MNALASYLALCAAKKRCAVRKATRRHVHLSDRPLVIVGYHLAGDVGAPLALMWGTDARAKPHTAVVPEPRNRQLRFDALAEFGHALVQYLDEYSETVSQRGRGGQSKEICLRAPQLVVPNRATADWLFGIVGRFTRRLRIDGDSPAPPEVPIAGKQLSFFDNLLPGSSLVLCATELLSTHWQTGQLASEDLNLSTLLGWIVPGEYTDGPTAARAGELLPPAGPLSDPNWDAQILVGLIDQWHEAKSDAGRAAIKKELDDGVREQLNHTWQDCWKAIELMSRLPEAKSVARRWEQDRSSWTRHHAAMRSDAARFRNVPTPTQAATSLRLLEGATADLKRDMALDDPLKMAAYVASGEALSAIVKKVDDARKVCGSKGRSLRRPSVTFESSLQFNRPVGTKLYLTSDPESEEEFEIELEILAVTTGATGLQLVNAQVNSGAVSPKTLCRLPEPGKAVVLSPFGKSKFYPSPEYNEVPWTHRRPEAGEVDQ